jgi:Mn2+/Fe2+ NRAMP family transporter
VFVGVITAMILIAAVVAVVPGIPVISLLIGVQVVNGVLLPINLFFIWRLARDTKVMGEHRNHPVTDALTAITVLFTGSLSLILVVVTILGY